jgi:hypothetical protein
LCDSAAYHPAFDLGLKARNDTAIGRCWEVVDTVTDTELRTEPFWREVGTKVYSHGEAGWGEGIMIAVAAIMFATSLGAGCVLRARSRKKKRD